MYLYRNIYKNICKNIHIQIFIHNLVPNANKGNWDWCRMEKRLFGTGAEWKKGCSALVPIIQKWLIGTGPFQISGP